MATVYTDDFSGNLNDWEDHDGSPPGNWSITSGELDSNTGGQHSLRVETAAYDFPDDIKVSIDIATTFSSFDGGPTTRWTDVSESVGDGYFGDVYSPNKVEIWRQVNGSDTKVSGSTRVGMADGDTLRLESEGTAHRFYVNDTLETNGTDSQHSTGQAGVYAWNTSSLFDNFSVDDFEAAGGDRRVMVIGWKEALLGFVVGALVKNPVTTRRFWFFLLALLLLASPAWAGTLSGGSKGQPDAWFQAGFENLTAPAATTAAGVCYPPNECWYGRLIGQDSQGFIWPGDMLNEMNCDDDKRIYTQLSELATFGDYLEFDVVDIGGAHGNVLMYKVIDATEPGAAFNARLEQHCDTTGSQLNSLYVAWDLYLPADFSEQICPGEDYFCWRLLFENREIMVDSAPLDQSRISLNLNRDETGTDQWYWNLKLGKRQGAGNWSAHWTDTYTTVLDDQWLRIELEVVKGVSDGSAKVWIDGVLRMEDPDDQTAFEADPDWIRADWIMLYTNSAHTEGDNPPATEALNPSWQYVDNVVVCGSRSECG